MLQIDSPLDSLRAELHSAEACAQQMAVLAERRGSLKAKINHMEKSPQGLQLQHAHSAAFARLQDTARDAVRRQLTQLLVDDVHHSFRQDCQPAVLQSAASWFSRFTQYSYTLEAPLTHGNEVTYEAVETSTRERKTLDMLSRGTRMQLLIAVRLAFAFEGERGKLPLPIFLDELLATSDPARFNAIVEVVTELVKEGRQVFYLTSQPTDLQCWQQHCPDAHIVDIPVLQGKQEFIRAPGLPQPKAWSYHEPSSSDVHAYAMSLGFLPATSRANFSLESFTALVWQTNLPQLIETMGCSYGGVI
jgi:uncharacterized protein YhaN